MAGREEGREPRRAGPVLTIAMVLFGCLILFAGFNIWRTTWRRKDPAPPPGKVERGPEEGPRGVLERLAGLDPRAAKAEREARVGTRVRWTGRVEEVRRPGGDRALPALWIRHDGGHEVHVIFPATAEAEILGLEGREVTYEGRLASLAPDEIRVVDAVLLRR
jgi:hypothetical protein